MATDAEVLTGTDQTRYINPKQLKDGLIATEGTSADKNSQA